MSAYTLRLWDESYTLDALVAELAGTPFQSALTREVGRILVLRRALKEHLVELELDESTKNTLLSRFGAKRGLTDTVALQRWFRENQTSPEALMERLALEERIERLKAVLVPPDKVKERFLTRKARLDQIVFAVIRLPKEAAAREVYYRLTHDRQDFSEMARRFSAGPEAAQGGVRGPVPVSDLNPELKRRLLCLPSNEPSEPFLLQDMYFIARLIRLEPAQLTDEMSKTLRDELFEEWMERQLAQARTRLNPPEPEALSRASVRPLREASTH